MLLRVPVIRHAEALQEHVMCKTHTQVDINAVVYPLLVYVRLGRKLEHVKLLQDARLPCVLVDATHARASIHAIDALDVLQVQRHHPLEESVMRGTRT